ncbi:hypothetical protein QTO34_016495 [Cnephaeus nilssonii]|uniref:Uncharacterized protein n=1 Tax=Cnephaeus nilssonii TaxID=3371016 RepID=A0AA40LPT4_CNENI|nr:hypothetical protein QTO34_016495 [Eptesicus nilssonii]
MVSIEERGGDGDTVFRPLGSGPQPAEPGRSRRPRHPPRRRENPANQPRKRASPNSHRGTTSGTVSSQNSCTVTWATQETGTRAAVPAAQSRTPPRTSSRFLRSRCPSPTLEQSSPNPETSRPRSPSPWDRNMRILETRSSTGRARNESKSLHCIPTSSWTTQACHSPRVQFSISFSSRFRFFQCGR